MLAGDQLVGLLNCYCGPGRITPDEDDLQLAAVFATTAAMGYANASAWRQLAELNRGLEGQVEARTRELRESLAEVEQLNADLATRGRQLEDAYARLAELDRVKGELIARVARELSAPVTSLHAASTILDDGRSALPEKLGRFVTVIRDESDTLSDLIDSMVQATVLTVGDVAEAARPVPVQDLLRQAIAPIRDLAARRGVTLNVFTAGGIDTVTCDPASMQTALRALIRNGIEFNRRGGSVRVEVRRVNRDGARGLELTVKDTGVGIPEADRELVFDTFWQGDNAADAAPHGFGLGLAIARRVVEAHRGSLRLDSVPDQGTEVRVVLPQH
jgi:signal transduction histidine kinase